MIGVVVVTHGQFATELVNGAEAIVGDLPQFAGRCDRMARGHAATRAKRSLRRSPACVRIAGVLILTDMFGGTPSNLAMTFLAEGSVEVVTGVNLPMLIKVAGVTAQADLLEVARELREQGRNAIWVASDLLRGEAVV